MHKLIVKALKITPPQPPVVGPGGKLGYWRHVASPYGKRRVFIPIEPSPAGRGGAPALVMAQAQGGDGGRIGGTAERTEEKTEDEWRQEALKYARGRWQRLVVMYGGDYLRGSSAAWWYDYETSLDNLIARLERAGIPVACEAISWLGKVVMRFGHKWVKLVEEAGKLKRQVEEVYSKLPKPHRKDIKLRELRKKLLRLKWALGASHLMELLERPSPEEGLEVIARLRKEFEEVANDEVVRHAIAEHAVNV